MKDSYILSVVSYNAFLLGNLIRCRQKYCIDQHRPLLHLILPLQLYKSTFSGLFQLFTEAESEAQILLSVLILRRLHDNNAR